MRLIKWDPLMTDEWNNLERAFSDFPGSLAQTKGFTPAIDG